MISFESDYIAGAHPKILERLAETNMEALVGYGDDKYCQMAEEKIKKACNRPNAKVHFLVGGTQTNQVVISSMLADYEGVIAATSGHISVHEGGAIEFTGHKVLTLNGTDGKLNAQDIDEYVTTFYNDGNHEHMVFPGLVYISHPTEYGTLYSKSELTAISNVCKKHNIPLFLDGARLGYGLASRQTDVTLQDIAELCDVFYIGGTKVGALCGEAVVFTHNNTPKHFITKMKQRGALLAKGRLLGIQFDTLFTDNLYMEISRHAIEMAEKLKSLLKGKGYRFYLESPTNQQFIILENEQMSELAQNVCFSFWEKHDDSHTIVRFATSWSTTEEDLRELEKVL
ncbi:MAG: low specificity L-threonine aldolase [Bacteroidales bacterium]|nr:low specificity L-threonine aldolase [Bacteroidales bacterium]